MTLSAKCLAAVILLMFSASLAFAISFNRHDIAERGALERIKNIVAADIDQDGDEDIVVSTSDPSDWSPGDLVPGRISWFENDGEWTEHTLIEADWYKGLAVSDLDQDGDLDVVAVASFGYVDDEIEPGSLFWLENDGNEEFNIHVIDADFLGANQVNVADMDNDDDLDIIATSRYSDAIEGTFGGLYIGENIGNGEFERSELLSDSAGQGLVNIGMVDFDQDGLKDIVTASSWGLVVSWFHNEGDLSFEWNPLDETIEEISSVDVADLDGDGDFDIVAGGWNDEFAWWENDGEENFHIHRIEQYLGGTQAISVTDVDANNSPDIITLDFGNDQVSWWSNEDDAAYFDLHRVDSNYESPYFVTTADINDDGLLDVVAGSFYGVLTWFEQTEDAEEYDSFRLPLDPGWSMISMPLVPYSLMPENVFAPLIDSGNLHILKDYTGHFLLPGEFSNLPPYDVDQGYWIRLHEADTLEIPGYYVNFRMIPFPQGWSAIAYFPDESAAAPTAFGWFRQAGLSLAKDDRGRFYLPSRRFHNMQPIQRDEGYLINMRRAGSAGWHYENR